MKATNIFAVAVMALALVAAPVSAQTRKERKAAKKAQWEMEQRHAREEAEMRHKLRMDSLANAQKIAEEEAIKAEAERKAAAEKAEAERRAAEAEARVKQRKAEEAAALQEVEFNEPCSDYLSSADVIFGRGMGEDFDQQMSVDIARTTALEELASQLSTGVQALVSNYRKQERKNVNRESVSRIEGLTRTEVDQATGYRIACRKTMTYVLKGERMFKTYMVVEINEDLVLHSIFNKIQKDENLKVDTDYEAFKKEFDEHFKSVPAEAAAPEVQ